MVMVMAMVMVMVMEHGNGDGDGNGDGNGNGDGDGVAWVMVNLHWIQVLGEDGAIRVELDDGQVLHGRPDIITDRPNLVMTNADVVIL